MKVLVDSISGDGLALALRLQDEGHEVNISIEKGDAQRAGEGLIEHVDDPMAHARGEDVDIVIHDMVGHGGMSDALRDLGIPTIGGGRALDLLELDRIAGLHTFRALGLTIPETELFEDVNFDRAIAHVKHDGGRWVYKPCGNLSTDKTFVGEDAEDLIQFIEHERERAKGEDVKYPAFVLQRFVEGIEVSIERWYSHGRPVPALDNMTFEEKKFLAGNLGPAIGCAGNIVMDVHPRLVAQTVQKLDRWALVHQATGPIDLNQIIAKDGRPHTLEATARFGYDALWAFLARWEGSIGEVFLALAEGDHTDVADLRIARAMAAAVRVSVPPYPGGDAKQARGVRIVDDVLDDPNIWLGDVLRTEEGDLEVAGVDGVVYVITALGASPKEAYGRCYEWLKESRLPDRQYRVDLVDRVEGDLTALARLGYHRAS